MAGFVGHAPVMDKARRVAAVLAAAASVTTIVGSALPLFTATLDGGRSPMELTITPWEIEVVGGYAAGGVPGNGFPLLFAAALLAFAAFWCRAAGRPGASPRTVRIAGATAVAGGAFLACGAWMVVLQVRYWARTFGPQDIGDGMQVGGETSYLAGLWVLAVAAVLGVATAVFAVLPAKQVAPVVAQEVDPDAPTPPFGIVLPLPPADEVAEPVEQVDPLTGLPFGQEPPSVPEVRDEPIVIPDAPPPEPPRGPAVPPVEDPLAEPRGD